MKKEILLTSGKLLLLTAAVTAVFTLTGCKNKDDGEVLTAPEASATEVTADATETEAAEAEASEKASAAEEPEETPATDADLYISEPLPSSDSDISIQYEYPASDTDLN